MSSSWRRRADGFKKLRGLVHYMFLLRMFVMCTKIVGRHMFLVRMSKGDGSSINGSRYELTKISAEFSSDGMDMFCQSSH